MIFHRSLVREFAQVALVVGAVLLAIILSSGVIRLLGKAAGGLLAPDAVAAMLAFALLNYLPIVLSLTLFIAVLLSLSRSYRDSEMVVWFSAGKSLTGWIRPVLMFALPLALIVALITLYLSPWAHRKSADFQNQLETRDDVSRVSPGLFIESNQADRVFFVEEISAGQGKVGNVFVQQVKDGVTSVVVAQRGHQETRAEGERWLVLSGGRHYQGTPGSAEFSMVDFERYAMRIEPREAKRGGAKPRTLSVGQLLREPSASNLAELHWRISMPISVVVLSLLAVPLSYVNPRAGRSVNLVIAILLYAIYSNLNSLTQAWIAQDKLSPAVGLWISHGIMLLICALLFWYRMSSFSLSRLWLRVKPA